MHTRAWLAKALPWAAMLAVAGCGAENEPWAGNAPPPPASTEPAQVRTYDFTHSVSVNSAKKSGKRWTVAILRFGDTKEVEGVPFGPTTLPVPSGDHNVTVKVGVNEDPSAVREAPPMVNKRAREILKAALVKSEVFNVVERERILEILREINFGKTRFVDPATSPDEGQLFSVRYLVEGSLGINEDKTLKDNIEPGKTYKDGVNYRPGLLDNVFNPGKLNSEKIAFALRHMEQERAKDRLRRENQVACYLSVYDVHTGAVTTTVMGIGGNGLEAINDAVDELVDELSSQDRDIYVAGVSGEGGKIYLDVGTGAVVKAGGRFQVIHRGQPIRDLSGKIIGYDESEVGEIEITDVGPSMSTAKTVRKVGNIVRGDLVKPVKN